MYKVFIVLIMVFLFTSCNEKKKNVKRVDSKSSYHLSLIQGRKIIGNQTGRHDTTMYMHYWVMELDGNPTNEGVMISEMLSDPNPLVSVYSFKEDTLIFIPVPAVSGTIPQVKELQLFAGKAKQLGVYYTRKDKDGSYSYRLAAYSLDKLKLEKIFDLKLYSISNRGEISDAYIFEVGKMEPADSSALCWVHKAVVKKDRAEDYMNKGPLLVKKKNAKPQLYAYIMWHGKYEYCFKD